MDVEDVAVGHILAMERGVPGQRYVLGNRNVSLAELYRMLADITGRPAPTRRLPLWAVIGAAWVDLFVEGVVARREPALPLEGLKVARTPMYVSCEKAVSQLGLPPASGGRRAGQVGPVVHRPRVYPVNTVSPRPPA